MIAIDTNILVYGHRQDSAFHAQAKECIRGVAEGPEPWAIPWPCIHEFVAIVTHPRIFKTPTPHATALAQVDGWMRSPQIVFLSEDEGYWEVFRDLLGAAKASGPKVHDARVAALALFHRVSELWTADRDFSRFSGLSVRNPL